ERPDGDVRLLGNLVERDRLCLTSLPQLLANGHRPASGPDNDARIAATTASRAVPPRRQASANVPIAATPAAPRPTTAAQRSTVIPPTARTGRGVARHCASSASRPATTWPGG